MTAHSEKFSLFSKAGSGEVSDIKEDNSADSG